MSFFYFIIARLMPQENTLSPTPARSERSRSASLSPTSVGEPCSLSLREGFLYGISMALVLAGFIFLPILFVQAAAQESQENLSKTNVVFFYSKNCPYCAKVKPVLDKLEKRYKNFARVLRYEVRESLENQYLFYKFLDAYRVPRGEGYIPAIFIGDYVLVGDKAIFENLEKLFSSASERFFPLKEDLDAEVGGLTPQKLKPPARFALSLPLVLGAAAVDSINPCAIAVLLFLVAFLIAMRQTRARLFLVGLVYIFAVFLAYLLAGFGLLKFIAVFDLSYTIRWVAVAMLAFAGILSIKDFFWYGRGISLKIPERAKPLIEKYLKRATIPAVFLAGFLVSAVELPCTGEVYLGILSLIALNSEKIKGLSYLVLYNLIFILPLILILFLAVFGLNIERIEQLKTLKRRWLRLLLGLAMLILAVWLIRA